MELLQMEYFIKLSEYEHLTRVAELMYVSPSAISSSIARLEDELGVKLFDRIGRNIKLNEYGRAYLPYVKRALSELRDGKKKISDMSMRSDNQITIVTSNPFLWQKAFHKFVKEHPSINLTTSLFDPLLSVTKTPPRDVDLMIMPPESFADPAWFSELLFEDRIALAVPPDHRLAKRKSISLSEAADEWFVRMSDSTFSQYCDNLCREAGFVPKSRITCDYMLRPEITAKEGMVALTTFNCRAAGLFANMVLIPLDDEGAVRHQSVFWRKAGYLSQPARILKEFLLQTYKDFSPMEFVLALTGA